MYSYKQHIEGCINKGEPLNASWIQDVVDKVESSGLDSTTITSDHNTLVEDMIMRTRYLRDRYKPHSLGYQYLWSKQHMYEGVAQQIRKIVDIPQPFYVVYTSTTDAKEQRNGKRFYIN